VAKPDSNGIDFNKASFGETTVGVPLLIKIVGRDKIIRVFAMISARISVSKVEEPERQIPSDEGGPSGSMDLNFC